MHLWEVTIEGATRGWPFDAAMSAVRLGRDIAWPLKSDWAAQLIRQRVARLEAATLQTGAGGELVLQPDDGSDPQQALVLVDVLPGAPYTLPTPRRRNPPPPNETPTMLSVAGGVWVTSPTSSPGGYLLDEVFEDVATVPGVQVLRRMPAQGVLPYMQDPPTVPYERVLLRLDPSTSFRIERHGYPGPYWVARRFTWTDQTLFAEPIQQAANRR